MIQQPANWRQYYSNVTEEQRLVRNYVQGVGGLKKCFNPVDWTTAEKRLKQ